MYNCLTLGILPPFWENSANSRDQRKQLEGNRNGKKETVLIWGHCLDFFRTLDCFSSNRLVSVKLNFSLIPTVGVSVKPNLALSIFVTSWTVAHQAPLSMEFSRKEDWSGLPFPSPGDLPDSGIEPGSPALQADSLSLSHQEALFAYKNVLLLALGSRAAHPHLVSLQIKWCNWIYITVYWRTCNHYSRYSWLCFSNMRIALTTIPDSTDLFCFTVFSINYELGCMWLKINVQPQDEFIDEVS